MDSHRISKVRVAKGLDIREFVSESTAIEEKAAIQKDTDSASVPGNHEAGVPDEVEIPHSETNEVRP